MQIIKWGIIAIVLFLPFSIVSCINGDHMQGDNSYKNIIDSISKKNWNDLSHAKIYFGHQSVGFNIIDGMKEIISENKKIKLRIKETDDPDELSEPLFVHSRIGKNGDWLSKIKDFQSKIKHGLGENTNIAFFKFCYVDITYNTDVQKLFDTYRQTMNNLQEEYPGTVFLYCTVPLTISKITWKTWIKKLIGKKYIWEYAGNMKRNEFNEMIRSEYGGKEKLFDIALAESTYPDGTQETFKYNGKKYASLVPEYSSDSGHLNTKGRKIVAAHLLKTLTGLAD